MLVDQHLAAGRDHRATPPTHGRVMIQHGFLEGVDEFRIRAARHEVFLDIVPPRIEFVGGICGVM
jgi:hypothetical protein